MNRRILVVSGLLILVVVVVSALLLLGSKNKKAPISEYEQSDAENNKLPNVGIQLPINKTLYRTLTVPGDVVPNQDVTFYARVNGYLETLNVDRGTWVKKDEIMAIIDIPDLIEELEKEKADLALTEPTLEKDKAELAWRKSQYDRGEKLVKESPDLVPEFQLDELRGEYEVAKAKLEMTKAEVEVLKAKVAKMQELVSFATIKAPFDGVVTDRWVWPGDLVKEGNTRLFHMTEVDPVRIWIYVPEPDVPFIKEGGKVVITIDELPGKKWEANVSRFSWALNSDTKTETVEIDVKNHNHEIRTGMFAHATIKLEAHKDVLTLPAGSLILEGEKTFVFAIRDGVAKKVPIKIGIDNGLEFEVIEGITGKDEIVISGKSYISDGEKVQATKIGTAK